MRSQSSFTRILVVSFLIGIALVPNRSVGSEDRAKLSDCDGEQLKDLKSLPEKCRNCVPLMVEGVVRCLPFFMPGDIKSAENDPISFSMTAILAREVNLMGFMWPAGTKLTTRGYGVEDIVHVEFPVETVVKGFPVVKMELWGFESIHIQHLKLPTAHSYGGYLWPKGSVLSFHYDSKEKPMLWYVMLGEESSFDGRKYPARKYVWFNKDGKIDLTAPKPKPLY